MFAVLPQVMISMVANHRLCCFLSQTRQTDSVWMTSGLIEQVGQCKLENKVRQARCCFAGEKPSECTSRTFVTTMVSTGSVHVEKLTEQCRNQE